MHSFSRLETFEICKRKFWHRYVDRTFYATDVEEREDEDDAPVKGENRGITVHREVQVAIETGTTQTLPFADRVLKVLGTLPPGACEETLYVTRSWEPVFVRKGAWAMAKIDYRGDTDIYDWKTGRPHGEHYDQGWFYSVMHSANREDDKPLKFHNLYLDRKRSPLISHDMDFFAIMEGRKHFTNKFNELEGWTDFFPEPGPHCLYCPYSRHNGGTCKF